MIDDLVAVGRDCDCGHPMIWRAGAQVCAVYGRHAPAPDLAAFSDTLEPGRIVHYRNRNAPGARLVALCMDAPNLTRSAQRHRALRAVS